MVNANSGQCICAVIGEVVIHDLKTAVQACVTMVFQTAIFKLIHEKILIVFEAIGAYSYYFLLYLKLICVIKSSIKREGNMFR